jgi:hypothetical protein
MRLSNWFESLRKWIDGEEDLDEQGKPRARSKWDDFLVAIAREVEATMQREMFTPPGGPTYVPREYVVFLHPDDDSEWQGEKREGLERGLHYVLTERAKELVGEKQFQTKSVVLELRVDSGLEKGRFRVQHVWDTEAQKTMVKPRKRAAQAAPAPSPLGEPSEDEATIVRPRKSGEPAFSMQVRRRIAAEESSAIAIQPFFKDDVTIGRGARQVPVDLRLEGDLEVSRKHATISKRADGEFRITCHGANPILVGDREIAADETAEVRPGDKISICSYEIVIGNGPAQP